MKPVSWSFWLNLRQGTHSPTQYQVEDALAAALPDFVITYVTKEPTGNPRDGFVHEILFSAQKGETHMWGSMGTYLTFDGKLTHDEADIATYRVMSIAPSVTSNEPWSVQEAWWKRAAEAFAPLGFEDRTLTSVHAHAIAQARSEPEG
jgi:hypothetical protein